MEVLTTNDPGNGCPDSRGGAGTIELDRIEAALAEVDAAMARLDDGTYGTCEVCGAGLGDDMLAAVPTARSCPAH